MEFAQIQITLNGVLLTHHTLVSWKTLIAIVRNLNWTFDWTWNLTCFYVLGIHTVRSSYQDNAVPSARLLSSGLRALQVPIPYDDSDHIPNDFLVFFLSQITFDIAKTLKEQTYDGEW